MVIVPPRRKRAPPALTTIQSGGVGGERLLDLRAPDRVPGDVEGRLPVGAEHEPAHRPQALDRRLLAPVAATGPVDPDPVPLEAAVGRHRPDVGQPDRLEVLDVLGLAEPHDARIERRHAGGVEMIDVGVGQEHGLDSGGRLGRGHRQLDERIGPLLGGPAHRTARSGGVEHRIDHHAASGVVDQQRGVADQRQAHGASPGVTAAVVVSIARQALTQGGCPRVGDLTP
jgi:hypothetical protein